VTLLLRVKAGERSLHFVDIAGGDRCLLCCDLHVAHFDSGVVGVDRGSRGLVLVKRLNEAEIERDGVLRGGGFSSKQIYTSVRSQKFLVITIGS